MSNSLPIRVLHVIDSLQTGGAERSLLEFTSRLNRDRINPLICSIYPGNQLADQFTAVGVEFRQLNLHAKYGLLRGVRRVAQLIKTENIDLLHTSLFRAGQIGRVASWWTKRPVISSFTNTPYSQARRQWDPAAKGWRHSIVHRLDRATSRLPTAFHSVSDSVAHQNCRDLHIDQKRVKTVYRGRDLEKFRERPTDEKKDLRSALGVNGAPTILNIGRLVPQKGQQLAIEMMARLQTTHPNATLLIAGSGPDEKKLQRMVRDKNLEDRIKLLGHREDIPQLLAIADAFVFPSHYEGLPGAIVEAMLAGTPIACSRIPMHEEFIFDNENGLLFPPADVLGMARATAALLDDPDNGQRLATKARQQAREQFDIEVVVRQMEDFLVQTWQSSQGHRRGMG